jgi:hypothetical protein
MQAVHLRAAASGLPDALGEQRMVLAQERADHEARGPASTATRSRCPASVPCRAPQVAGVGVAGAVVDVLAAQAAHQLGQQVQFFGRGVGAADGADAGAPNSAFTRFRPSAT